MRTFLDEARWVVAQLDVEAVAAVVTEVEAARGRGGRVIVLGLGGSAANASHAAADLRRLAAVRAVAPTDNVAELTARANDDGFDTVFSGWLESREVSDRDLVIVLSVGGGDSERGVSVPLIEALRTARQARARVAAVVGRDGGFTASVADALVIVPHRRTDMVTALAESMQALVWHLVVMHPRLAVTSPHWEMIDPN